MPFIYPCADSFIHKNYSTPHGCISHIRVKTAPDTPNRKTPEKASTAPTACCSSFLSLLSPYANPSLSYLSDAPTSHSNSSCPSTSQNSPQHSQTIARGASKTPAQQEEDIPHLLFFLRRRRGWGRDCERVCVCVCVVV